MWQRSRRNDAFFTSPNSGVEKWFGKSTFEDEKKLLLRPSADEEKDSDLFRSRLAKELMESGRESVNT